MSVHEPADEARAFAQQAGVDALVQLARETAETHQFARVPEPVEPGRHRRQGRVRRAVRVVPYAVAVAAVLVMLAAMAWYVLVGSAANGPQLAP